MTFLAAFIRDRRGDLSREALAARCRELAPTLDGFHRTAVDRWETGQGTPSPAQLAVLFAALEVADDDRLEVIRRAGEAVAPAAEAS